MATFLFLSSISSGVRGFLVLLEVSGRRPGSTTDFFFLCDLSPDTSSSRISCSTEKKNNFLYQTRETCTLSPKLTFYKFYCLAIDNYDWLNGTRFIFFKQHLLWKRHKYYKLSKMRTHNIWFSYLTKGHQMPFCLLPMVPWHNPLPQTRTYWQAPPPIPHHSVKLTRALC